MSAYILLPPLSHSAAPIGADTPVHWVLNAQCHASTLQQALTAQPKAIVLLHAVDAPLVVQTLPPLPKAKRETALRVVLEDRILGEMSALSLAILPLGGQQFAVAYCERSVLGSVQAALQAMRASNAISAVSAHLKADAPWVLGGWAMWASPQGAGASPSADLDTTGQIELVASALRFAQPSGTAPAWRHWRWVAYAAALCLAVFLMGQWLYWQSLVRAQERVQQRINTAFKAALPTQPQSKDPLKQMQRTLSSQGSISPIGTAMSKVPEDIPAQAIQGFEWKAGNLILSVSKSKLPLADAAKSALSARLATDKISLQWVD